MQFTGRPERNPGLRSGLRILLVKGPQPLTSQEASHASPVDRRSGSLPVGQRLKFPPFIDAHTPECYEVVCSMNTL